MRLVMEWVGATFQKEEKNSLALSKALLKGLIVPLLLKMSSFSVDYFPSYSMFSYFLVRELKKVIINQLAAHLAKFNLYEKFMSTFRLYDSTKTSLN